MVRTRREPTAEFAGSWCSRLSASSGRHGGCIWKLRRLARPDVILVQNPAGDSDAGRGLACGAPAQARDSSSTGTTWRTPSPRCGSASTIARCGRWPEASVAGRAALTVIWPSRARWREWLLREYGVKAAVLYDRPLRSFGRPDTDEAPASFGRSSRRRACCPTCACHSWSARPVGRLTKISICCSKRSSVPSATLAGGARLCPRPDRPWRSSRNV